MNNLNRKLTITRKNSLSGCALKFAVYLDGVKAGIIANGSTLEIPMDSASHTLLLKPLFPMIKGPEKTTISAGFSDVEAFLRLKNPLGVVAEWKLDVEYTQGKRDFAKSLIAGIMLMLSSGSDSRSLYPKMKEFRRAGLELQVNFTVRAEDVLVSPQELIENRSVGESFTLNYHELTALEGQTAVNSFTSGEQLDLAREFEQRAKSSGDHSHLIISRNGAVVSLRLKP